MIAPATTIRKRLRLRHLQLMMALSETESLRSAADELAMTQPAATKALKELEDTIGATLFVRHARGMEPTIYGEAVMRYARVVFEDLDELREELAAIEAGDIGKVRIGAVMAPAPDLLTKVIVQLRKRIRACRSACRSIPAMCSCRRCSRISLISWWGAFLTVSPRSI